MDDLKPERPPSHTSLKLRDPVPPPTAFALKRDIAVVAWSVLAWASFIYFATVTHSAGSRTNLPLSMAGVVAPLFLLAWLFIILQLLDNHRRPPRSRLLWDVVVLFWAMPVYYFLRCRRPRSYPLSLRELRWWGVFILSVAVWGLYCLGYGVAVVFLGCRPEATPV